MHCRRISHVPTNTPPDPINVESNVVDRNFVALWNGNIQALYNLPLRERPYLTKVNKQPSEDLMRSVDYLADNHLAKVLRENGVVTLSDLNSTLYVAAVTIQGSINDSREAKQPQPPRKIGWISNEKYRTSTLLYSANEKINSPSTKSNFAPSYEIGSVIPKFERFNTDCACISKTSKPARRN